ncbi:acriflavin resistance protein [[Leptolyngbya] sp. PCC 7376]|uniref:efflux RND transporter permease subunit n=1 Tax=[Leptolyngbya] sp. PCC 7376 TaxID=111781 RepID=UPI00029ED27A|nr:efflux RND transporter permease subunit [[Leptolyngbya] sp. PCC 7376]AFY40353.1 acriflavin resistance protein [[Leptolyngbya] sp. PCC 7376]
MFNLFYRNTQLLILTLVLIVVWGMSAFLTLPRMEDPELVQRFGTVTTLFPGATPERVEALVTEKIEEELFELEEITSLVSTSSRNISIVQVELAESIIDVDPVWSEVRSKLNDIVPLLPSDAQEPEYEDGTASANALILGLTWELDSEPNYNILRRVGENLSDRMRALPGTKEVELFGDVPEEIRINITSSELARLGLTPQGLAQQIRASDAKVAAGQLRSDDTELLIEIDSALDSLARIRDIPIKIDRTGQTQTLGNIAQIEKGIEDPASEITFINGRPAIALAATVESNYRVDLWAETAKKVVSEFEANLSDGIELQTVLDQSIYVKQRLDGVIDNLILSSSLVVLISLIMLGWQSALIVGAALPLATLMVFGFMGMLKIPLHQMSVTGIIIALGLLIDNAIVAVDEVQHRLAKGSSPAEAVHQTVKHLFVPLLASTLTTVLAFCPIALSPGATGEFIGAIGSTVILAVISSLFLSLTVIVALIAKLNVWLPRRAPWQWLQSGFANKDLTKAYGWSLNQLFRRPWLTVGICLILPILGFSQFGKLDQQFFPPTNRDQFQIEFTMPASTAIAETQKQAMAARELIRDHDDVDDVHWFFGKSAPAFFYNVIEDRDNAPNYAQGVVQMNSTETLQQTIQELQIELDAAFPQSQVLVRQLEQGPPFEAPIELRLYGSDFNQLREIGNELRGELAKMDQVIHTQADLSEVVPKLSLQVDEVQARRVGLDYATIANQLQTLLEGSVGGSILEDTEELPIRVRVTDGDRQNLDKIQSLNLVSPTTGDIVPLGAITTVDFVPSLAQINRYDGERVNTVLGYLEAGALPATVLGKFNQHLEDISFELPQGYRLAYGGEADAQGSAVSGLLGTVGVLFVMMAATLILSFNSFGFAALIGTVAICTIGLGALALLMFNSLFGFTAILGSLGLMGLAINDSIVVLAALREDPEAKQGNYRATAKVVLQATRHVLATTFTTIVGFTPLVLDPTGFWPPLAIALAGGLGGATLLALYYIPAAHILILRRKSSKNNRPQLVTESLPQKEYIAMD